MIAFLHPHYPFEEGKKKKELGPLSMSTTIESKAMSMLWLAVVLVVSSCFQPHVYSTVVKKCPSLPCVRMFHSKGAVGCRAADRHPTPLPLYMIEEKEDGMTGDELMAALESIQEPVALVARDDILGDSSLMNAVLLAESVQALVLIPDGKDGIVDKHGLRRYSPDVESPQGEGTPPEAFDTDPQYKWNVGGSGILEKDISIPIVFVQEKHAAHDVKVNAMANRKSGIGHFPRHMATFDFYFGGKGVTSKSCLGWIDLDGEWNPKCAPLGGQSAWGTAGSIDKQHPVVMVTAGYGLKIHVPRCCTRNQLRCEWPYSSISGSRLTGFSSGCQKHISRYNSL